MATVPNQRKVTIHREECKKDFLLIKKENWYAANKDLEPYGLQLYLYLAGNKDGFNLELSQEAAENIVGIKKTTFHKYINLMIEKGYLVQRKEGSNLYDFYETPQETKIKKGVPLCEQDDSQDVKSKENSVPCYEFLSLLNENDNSQNLQDSSSINKEINNITDTSEHIKINKGEFRF